MIFVQLRSTVLTLSVLYPNTREIIVTKQQIKAVANNSLLFFVVVPLEMIFYVFQNKTSEHVIPEFVR
jgi:hypothetical protein